MPYLQMTPEELEAEVGERIRATLAEFSGTRSGSGLKKWRREQRRKVGSRRGKSEAK